jgi:hypothetical protein
VKPASTGNVAPEMYRPTSLTRKAIALEMSTALMIRPASG